MTKEIKKTNLVMLKTLTVLIWVAVFVAGIYLFTAQNKLEKNNDIQKNKETKTLPVDFASKGVLEKFADDSPLGHKNVNAFIYKILPNIFTNWDEKNLFKHFSNNKNSQKNIENLKKQLPKIKELGEFISGRIIGYNKIEKAKCAIIKTSTTFKNDKDAQCDFIIVKEKEEYKILMFRIRSKIFKK